MSRTPTTSLVELGTVADVNPKAPGGLSDSDVVSFMPLASVDTSGSTTSGEDSRRGDVRKGHPYFQSGDILLAKITPSFENGKIAISKTAMPDGYTSTEFHVIRPHADAIDENYLLAYLRTGYVRSYCSQRMKGSAGQKRVPADVIKKLEIPLAPMATQKAISKRFGAIGGLIEGYHQSLNRYDELVKSRFIEMFERESFQSKPLEKCCDLVCGGSTPSMRHEEFYGGQVPFVKSGDVKSDLVSSGALWLTDEALEHGGARLLPGGCVLVVTRSALLKRQLCAAVSNVPVVINQDIKAFHPISGIMPQYLLHAIRSQEAELLHGVRSVNTSSIKTSDLYSLPIPIPPLELQQQFADFVAQVDKLEFETHQGIEKLHLLYNSLAQEYFS